MKNLREARQLKSLNTPSRNSGFTLIELSIVLIVIGTIIGGILTSRVLVRSAKVRSIVSDYQKFKTAVSNFEQKYDSFPGDFDNAQTFWGAAADCTSAQTTLATCNGDGNGLIDVSKERHLFWKHLANAGLIQGNFIGIKDGAGTSASATTDRNAPSGKIADSLWYVSFWGTTDNDPDTFNGAYGTMMYIGLYRVDTLGNVTGPYKPAITVSEMSAMDIKMDDGKPGTGNLRSRLTGGTCSVKADGVTPATSTDITTAIYKVSATGDQCVPTFPNAF